MSFSSLPPGTADDRIFDRITVYATKSVSDTKETPALEQYPVFYRTQRANFLKNLLNLLASPRIYDII